MGVLTASVAGTVSCRVWSKRRRRRVALPKARRTAKRALRSGFLPRRGAGRSPDRIFLRFGTSMGGL